MKMRAAIAMVALSACACSASNTSTKSADQRAVEDLDNAFSEHVERTALPRTVATQAGFKEQLSTKSESLKVLERAYTEFAASQEPVVAAHAARRLGQLYLNIGCEIATLEITTVSEPKFRPAVQEMLTDTARPLLDRARAHFGAATGGEGPHADEAGAIVEQMESAQLQQVCAATSVHWAATQRPEVDAPVEPAIASGDCDGALIALGGAPPARCFETFSKKCAAGDAAACLQVGRHHYFAGALLASHEAFSKACELDGRCMALAGFALPADKAKYMTACEDGDGLSCLKLARLADPEGSSLAQCSSKKTPDESNAQRRCQDGVAEACWAWAGVRVAAKPVEFPSEKAGVLGMLVGSGRQDGESDSQRRERLTTECRQGMSWSCVALTADLEDAGEDPVPVLRDACKHGEAGCHALATHLLESDDAKLAAEAVDLMVKNCAQSSTSCITAARLFARGEHAPKSAGCAAALSWQMCTPTQTWECEQINDVFGHGVED